jgi:hypothetical protein
VESCGSVIAAPPAFWISCVRIVWSIFPGSKAI